MTKLPALKFRRYPTATRAWTKFPGDAKERQLGRADTPTQLADVQRRFDALLALWLANGRSFPAEAEGTGDTVDKLADAYCADRERKHGAGWATAKGGGSRTFYALRELRRLFGTEPAASFDLPKLEAVRASMVESGSLCAPEINARIGSIRSAFRWACKRKLAPRGVVAELDDIEPITAGEFGTRDGKGRDAVTFEAVVATLPHLPPPLDVVVELLYRTGARPSEVLSLRAGDIDTSDPERWVAVLEAHKNAKKGKTRVLVFEQAAQLALAPFLDRDASAYLFAPAEGFAAGNARRRATGPKPVVTEGEMLRLAEAREARRAAGTTVRTFGERYDQRALRKAVKRAISRANAEREVEGLPPIEKWTPYQLRHAVATEADVATDRETAAAQLGHASVATTQHYAHDAIGKAKKASEALAGRDSLRLLDERLPRLAQ